MGRLVEGLVGVRPLGDADHLFEAALFQVAGGIGESNGLDASLIPADDLGKVVDVHDDPLAEVLANDHGVNHNSLTVVLIRCNDFVTPEKLVEFLGPGKKGIDFDEDDQIADLRYSLLGQQNEMEVVTG